MTYINYKNKNYNNKNYYPLDDFYLSIFCSKKNLYVQIIDNITNTTIVSSSSLYKRIKCKGCLMFQSFCVGKDIAKKSLSCGIFNVRINKFNKKYSGYIQSAICGISSAGLCF